ncbi:MAG: T9SS type A sorting domain-containing protein [Candidatus Azobacteroides sp.]|nr:T9SS type A sorting domain-containing protein [Candidatus Azobacteroides sp.]
MKNISNILLICSFLLAYTLLQAQQPFSYFFVGNTLSPTLFTQESDIKMKIEVILNPVATLSKTPVNSNLASGYSFSGTPTAVPTNFSTSYLQSFKVANGANITDIALSVKQIKRRTAPFSLVFGPALLPSGWTISTTGWVGQGLGNAEDILLDQPGATFIIAYTGTQNLLTFEMESLSSETFSGLFTVEASAEGNDGTWRNVLIKDDCNNPFLQGKSTVKLLLPQKTQFVRFVLNRTAENQAVLLNRFSIAAYAGENLGEFPASIHATQKENKWKLQSAVAKDYLTLIVPENITQWTTVIYDMNGRALNRGANLSRIPVNELPAGVYTLSIFSQESNQNLKFIKK